MADEPLLFVKGRRYGGWKSIRVTRSIESLAGQFAVDVSDRWGQEIWPILEEDECRVEIDGETVLDGYIGKRSLSASKDSRSLSYSGRDRSAALVDNSAVLPKWTYRTMTVADFAVIVAKPFGVSVSVQPGLSLAKVPKIVVSPGDTAYEALSKVAADEGVLLVSDGASGLLITRVGTSRATALIEFANVLTASVDYDADSRFHKYILATQIGGTDEASGDATRVQAQAIDEGVRRTDRVLMIRPDKGYNQADARRRADWEARTRAARAEAVTVTVQGWRQPNGLLWPVNAITRVSVPTMIGVDGDMVITQVEFSKGDQGSITTLRLVRPDAFTPEPKAAVVKASGGAWKELAKGGR